MGSGQAPATAIPMTPYQLDVLSELGRKHTTAQQIAKRIQILLLAQKGNSNSAIKRALNISLNTVKQWRKRWLFAYDDLVAYEAEISRTKVSELDFQKRLLSVLQDKPRSGTPKKISLAQEQKIVALACDKPIDHDIRMTDWTHEMLAITAISENIVPTISASQVGRILKNTPPPTPQIRVLAIS